MPKIQAYFRKMLDANKAVESLNAHGYKGAHLDSVDDFMDEYSEEINFAGSETGPSLSALVLKSGRYIDNVGKAPLTAASPMVSGIGSFEHISDSLNTRLIVNVEESKVEDVKKLLKDMGGSLTR